MPPLPTLDQSQERAARRDAQQDRDNSARRLRLISEAVDTMEAYANNPANANSSNALATLEHTMGEVWAILAPEVRRHGL